MKSCTKCGEVKPYTEFYQQKDRRNGSSQCRQCFNAMCRDRWISAKLRAIAHLGGSCSACGYSQHYAALQFHHVDPSTKEFEWHKIRLMSWERQKPELEKCALLCANCHAVKHSYYAATQSAGA